MGNQDKYLKRHRRNGVFLYQRVIPKDLIRFHDGRKLITRSTETSSIFEARTIRDQFQKADDAWFAALRAGRDAESIRDEYEAALKIRNALGTEFLHASTFSEALNTGEVLQFSRVADEVKKKVRGRKTPNTKQKSNSSLPTVKAVTRLAVGGVEKPKLDTVEVFKFWMEKRAHSEIKGKSPEQIRQWRNPLERARNNFAKIAKKQSFLDVSRDVARRYYDQLNERIISGKITPNTGNRDFGVLRKIWQDYADYLGDDRPNPFRRFRWKDPKDRREGYTANYLQSEFLHGTKLSRLNSQARHVLLVLIETGCRPSEILNLEESAIVLDHEIPHLNIRPTPTRQLKTKSSKRILPLVGIALPVMQANPKGFPRYKDRDSGFSLLANKYLTHNHLREKPEHTVYSIRHAYEDRMKDAQIDLEMRKQIAGHSLDRSAYGRGFQLAAVQAEMARIALEYDLAVV